MGRSCSCLWKVVVAAASDPPNIVTALCICCSCYNTQPPSPSPSLWSINKVYSIKVSQNQGSVVSDPALHVKTKPRPCSRAKQVSGNCCRYRGDGQFAVVSSVCSGGVTRASNWQPPTSKKKKVCFLYFFWCEDSDILPLGWRQRLLRLLNAAFKCNCCLFR